MVTKPNLNFTALKTTIYSGINDSPLFSTQKRGSNGSDLVIKVNTLCDSLTVLLALLSDVAFSANYNDIVNTPTDLSSSLGTAAYYNVGDYPNQVVKLDQNGKLSSSLITGLGSAAYEDAGTGAGDVLLLDDGGKLSSSLITGLGSAAYKDAGTGVGDVLLLDDDGKLSSNLITGLGSAAYKDAGTGVGDVLLLDDDGKLSYTLVKDGPKLLPTGIDKQYLVLDSQQESGTRWSTLGVPYQIFSGVRTNSFTVVQEDHGMWIPCSTNNLIVTLPVGLINGTQVIIDRQSSATVTFEAGAGATMLSKSTNITSQYGVVHAVLNGTQWRLTGDL